jgi:deoxyribodipyrimidine photo-lyase
MAGSAIPPERIRHLNKKETVRGRYVLYWMQQAQRATFNHALEFAIEQANALEQPVLVVFGLTDAYPDANLRHYAFMLEGLRETAATLERRGIRMTVREGDPVRAALEAARDASLIACDRGYLRHQRRWRHQVAAQAPCCVVQVETDVTVPVETISDKAAYAARTIRPKLHRQLDRFLDAVDPVPLAKPALDTGRQDGVALDDVQAVLSRMRLDASVKPVSDRFRGGASEAQKRLDAFLKNGLAKYVEKRTELVTGAVSHLGPYLHFGQISPVHIAIETMRSPHGNEDAKEAFLEELIVRRELACNFVSFTPDYDAFTCLPEWARKTLRKHRGDLREHVYTRTELEQGQTHDPYWNAAMETMRLTGALHNHLRMYWGKKILEWSPTAEQAYETALALNNKYFLDGRDPNSYANIGWVFGLHDRPWKERAVFGTVRYMSAGGLERKCDMDAYLAYVEELRCGARSRRPRRR